LSLFYLFLAALPEKGRTLKTDSATGVSTLESTSPLLLNMGLETVVKHPEVSIPNHIGFSTMTMTTTTVGSPDVTNADTYLK
jgi:hypothetical protein